jgi:hypothetical protein
MWGQFWVSVFLTSAYPYKQACDSLLTLLPSPDHYHPLENQKPMCASILFLTLASGSHPHHKNPPFSSSYPHLSPVKHLSVQVLVCILSEFTSLSLSLFLCICFACVCTPTLHNQKLLQLRETCSFFMGANQMRKHAQSITLLYDPDIAHLFLHINITAFSVFCWMCCGLISALPWMLPSPLTSATSTLRN